jgi:DNA mismatch repair protein MutL
MMGAAFSKELVLDRGCSRAVGRLLAVAADSGQDETMQQVQKLSPEVIEQIAAGEVIERPASAVRELIDNSLDAGASRVDVTIERGGMQMLSVSDDGSGLAPKSAAMALERHATSKLGRLDDLFTLRTLGFRGEGLSSVCAVSRLELVSCVADSAAGVRLSAEGGKRVGEQPAARKPGTTVTARDLLYNVPARRRFLKSTATEGAKVLEVVQQLALAHPQVYFTLTSDGRKLLDLPAAASRAARVRQVLCGELSRSRARGTGLAGEELSTAQLVTTTAHLEACLFAQLAKSSRGLMVFVNRRVVTDRVLRGAVNAGFDSAGFGERLSRGSYPKGVVFLELAGDHVDINVHPQKREIRFAEPKTIFEQVRAVVARALGAKQPVVEPPSGLDHAREERLSRASGLDHAREERLSRASGLDHAREERLSRAIQPRELVEPTSAVAARVPSAGSKRYKLSPRSYREHSRLADEATRRFFGDKQAQKAAEQSVDYGLGGAMAKVAAKEGVTAAYDDSGELPRLVGEAFAGRQLVIELGTRLLVIDRERALMAIAKRRIKTGVCQSRTLVPALTMKLRGMHEAALSVLANAGFLLESFGGDDYVLRRVLDGIDAEAASAVLGALDFKERDGERLAAQLERAIAEAFATQSKLDTAAILRDFIELRIDLATLVHRVSTPALVSPAVGVILEGGPAWHENPGDKS